MRLFVTGTGTEVGKTYVTRLLLRGLARAGRAPRGLKPVMSGYDAEGAAACDAALLLAAAGSTAAIEDIAPFRYAAPLSPDMAARAEGRALDYPALLDFCAAALAGAAPVLIEGVGGVMVPLTDTETVLDWMAALGLPVLLVAGSYLGALSHTLTALAVLRGRGLAVPAVVVNETPGGAVDLAATAATIGRHGKVRTVCVGWQAREEPAFGQLLAILEPG